MTTCAAHLPGPQRPTHPPTSHATTQPPPTPLPQRANGPPTAQPQRAHSAQPAQSLPRAPPTAHLHAATHPGTTIAIGPAACAERLNPPRCPLWAPAGVSDNQFDGAPSELPYARARKTLAPADRIAQNERLACAPHLRQVGVKSASSRRQVGAKSASRMPPELATPTTIINYGYQIITG